MSAIATPLITLVEDNPADVYMFRRALSEKGVGFQLTHLADGEAAVAAFSRINKDVDAPLPDLVVLDLNLPKIGGIEVLSQMRQLSRLRQVPVAILTSSTSPVEMRTAYELGAVQYLRKPTMLDEFLEHVGQGVKDLLVD
ncbi:MAG: response regulator [Bryobacteraceae bacterium]